MTPQLRILITGSTGFVGSELLNSLSSLSQYEVYRIVRNIDEKHTSKDIYLQTIDGTTNWDGILDKIDIVIHLAAKVHDMNFKESEFDDESNIFYKINYEGTKKLVDDSIKNGVKKIIFLSTIKVNGESGQNSVFSEFDIPNPIDSYGKSKLKAENYIIEKSSSIDYIIIRPTLIIGANVKGNIRKLMKLINKGFVFPYFKKENKRSFVGLRNLCELIIYCLEHPNFRNEIVIASEMKMLSTKDLIQKISRSMGKKVLYVVIPGFFSLIFKKVKLLNKIYIRLYDNLIVHNDKLYKKVGWKPKYSIDEEIEHMTESFRIEGEIDL